MIEPFANDAQSMQIGELVIENGRDKIIIYGDLELMPGNAGHEQARRLHELTTKILAVFDEGTSYTNTSDKSKQKNDQQARIIDNPFL